MEIFLNFGLAWISVLLALFLSVSYITKKAFIEFPLKRTFFIKLNKKVRMYHKEVGIILLITGLVHGIFSTEVLFSINWGTALWIISILLGISWMLRKKLAKRKGWIYYHRVLVVFFLFTIVIHVVDVGGIQVFKVIGPSPSVEIIETAEPSNSPTSSPKSQEKHGAPESATPDPTAKPIEGNIYKDGTYTGEATGYQPGLIVSVTIKNNEISVIEITEHHELNSKFWSTPVAVIPNRIIESQDTEVDTITGATYTSVGIVNAVRDALSKALVSGSIPEDMSLSGKRN